MSQVQVNKKKQKQHRRYEGVFDQAQTYDEGLLREKDRLQWTGWCGTTPETKLRLSIHNSTHNHIEPFLLPFWCGNVV